MTKAGGLGSLPQGLEWITKKKILPETPSNKSEEPLKPLDQVEMIPKGSIKQIEDESNVINKLNTVTSGSSTMPIDENVAVVVKPQKLANKQLLRSANIGLQEGFIRATFIIKEEHIEKLKALSYVKQIPIKDLVDQAMNKFLKDKNVADILSEAIKNNLK